MQQNPESLARLRALYASWDQFPGREPNGSGLTGLNSNDSLGYSKMLNEQTEGMNLENELQGKGPVNIRMGFDERLPPSIADDPASSFNTSTGPFGAFGVGTGGNVPTLSAEWGAHRPPTVHQRSNGARRGTRFKDASAPTEEAGNSVVAKLVVESLGRRGVNVGQEPVGAG